MSRSLYKVISSILSMFLGVGSAILFAVAAFEPEGIVQWQFMTMGIVTGGTAAYLAIKAWG